eukprot:COSAG01_NODE_286_length_19421_cov_123.895663_11_plen_96_part_00
MRCADRACTLHWFALVVAGCQQVGWDIMTRSKTGEVEDELTRSIRLSRSAIEEEWQQHCVAEQLPFITADILINGSIVGGDIARYLLKVRAIIAT